MNREYELSRKLSEFLNKVKNAIKPGSSLLSVMLSYIESALEYRKWIKEIPPIPFKKEWLVKIIPPFGGVIVRFLVAHKDNPERYVSVYLDCYNTLGLFFDKNNKPAPYWEVYPVEGDNYRVAINNVEELLKVIEEALAS